MTFKTVGPSPCSGRRLSLFDKIISLFAELGNFYRKCLIRRDVELAFQPSREGVCQYRCIRGRRKFAAGSALTWLAPVFTMHERADRRSAE
jgi:hypothetical protein